MLVRTVAALACCLTLGLADAQAHFIWIDLAPASNGQPQARLFFSELPEPGEPHLIGKIAPTKAWRRDAKGNVAELKVGAAAGESAELPLTGTASTGDCQPTSLEATCDYGVYQRGPAGILLQYYAKRLAGDWSAQGDQLGRASRLALDIVPQLADGKLSLAVLFQEKPSQGSEVVIVGPTGEHADLKTDEQGHVAVKATAGGRYAIRAAHIETDRNGTRDGKKYAQTWHYCTLLLDVAGSLDKSAAKDDAEPSAAELLKRARQGRSMWQDFPGFSADLTVTSGKEQVTGSATIDSSGSVTLDMKASPLADWVEEQLNSLVQHRMPDGEVTEGNVVYADDDRTHPLGRKINLGDSELSSAYRIKDDVIMEVNRSMGKMRFTISVLEIVRDEQNKYLPRAFTMNFFDAASGELKTSLGYWNQWQRVGNFELPKTILEVSAHPGGTTTRQIEFSNCKLK